LSQFKEIGPLLLLEKELEELEELEGALDEIEELAELELVELVVLAEETKTALLSDQDIAIIFSGLYDLFGCAVRNKIKDTVVSADLAKVKFPAMFIKDIVTVYAHKRESLEAGALSQRMALPSVKGVNWRVDVTISTTSLSRVFKPSVTLQLTLSDGRISTFECSVKKFHELRYNVAKVLKDIADLQQHPTLTRDM